MRVRESCSAGECVRGELSLPAGERRPRIRPAQVSVSSRYETREATTGKVCQSYELPVRRGRVWAEMEKSDGGIESSAWLTRLPDTPACAKFTTAWSGLRADDGPYILESQFQRLFRIKRGARPRMAMRLQCGKR